MSPAKEFSKVLNELPNCYDGKTKYFPNGENYTDFYCEKVVLYTRHQYSNGHVEYRRVASISKINKLLKKHGSKYRIGNSRSNNSGGFLDSVENFFDVIGILALSGLFLILLILFPIPSIIIGIIIYFIYKKFNKR